METNLYFVRHAHSTYSPDEYNRPLSARGFTDVKQITHLLKEENIDLIISSPYLRAKQTVEGIAKLLDKEILIMDDFKERILSNKKLEEFQVAISRVWENPTYSWEGGESNLSAQKRGVKVTLEVVERFKGKNIVIGTHGNIMVLIMNHFNNKFDFPFWQQLDMPDIYKLTFNYTKLIDVKRLWYRTKQE
ncbi:histidine phosphatase family protein [Heyndrickxia oleronia]|uniref:Histidine phosphatase family protein n=1 Tax=Heyndrickxia oleronia TaxID=38875 RepID=A0AAW6SYT7_9BACI|nr:histidine phosphatase family protein [Heyndrickxia oleronia]MDH5162437.1 histidine phosphatase family protein [Heyndrickxia oleronia]